MKRSSRAALDVGSWRVLRWLDLYPFQRGSDLVVALAPWERRSAVYQRLAHLTRLHLVESIHLPTTPGGLSHLSPLGRAICAGDTGPLVHRPVSPQEREQLLRLLPRLPVLLRIQDLINGLVTGAARALSEQGRQARVIQWNWGRDYAQRFIAHGQELAMRADGALALRLFPSAGAPTPLWYSFLLLHCPLDDARLFRQRLDRIVRWREAETWTPERQMPLVLILATTPRQAEWWHQATSQVARRLHTDELVGAVACWPTSQPQMESWRLTWRRLGTTSVCHVQDLLHPATETAFPALTFAVTADYRAHQEATIAHQVHLPARRSYALMALSQREPVRDERVLVLRLHPTHWRMLVLCFAHPLLGQEHLATFLGVGPKTAARLLREGQVMGYLTSTETSAGRGWYLAERGLRLCAQAMRCQVQRFLRFPLTQEEPHQRGVKGLVHQASHTAGIYGFFALLTTALAALPGARLRFWETGAICERVFVWQGNSYHFKPDAYAEVRLGNGQSRRFWVEWDRGTMMARDLERKCATYAAFLTSREWTQGSAIPPALLCVFPERSQEIRFGKTAQALLAHVPGLRLYTTTVSMLMTQGALQAIWRLALAPSPRERVAFFA